MSLGDQENGKDGKNREVGRRNFKSLPFPPKYGSGTDIKGSTAKG